MRDLRIFPKFIFLSVILFNFSCSVVFQGKDNEWTTVNITQNRDMSQYEEGGHFWCRNRPYGNFGDIKRGEKKVRDFIWQHWTEKKRGYIKFTCGYTDTSRTIHYFIEPNEKGEWNIARRDIFQNLENEKTMMNDVLISIERIETENNNSDWTLISRNKTGEIIERLPIY
jgi:hypothetical protein